MVNKAKLSDNLSFKQARLAVLLAFSLGVVFSIVQIGSDLISERDRTDVTFQRILRVANDSAVQAAYGLDDNLARKVIDGLFEYDAVFKAQIKDNHNEILAQREMPEKQGSLKIISEFLFGSAKTYSLNLRVRENLFEVGSLEISVDTFVIADHFFQRSSLILLFGVIRNLMLAGILGVLFHLMLTKPLKRVIRNIELHQSPVDVPESHENDELGELVEAFNDQFQQRAKAENFANESEERFRNYAEASSDWFWEMDADLIFTYGSERFFELTGFPPENFYGNDRWALINTRQEDPTDKKWRNHFLQLENHEPFRDFKYRVLSSSGEVIHMSINGNPIFDQSGKFAGYRGTGSDISDLMSTSEQLRRSQKMDAIGQLTGGIAHDFNNILGIVMGNLEILQQMVSGNDAALGRIAVAIKGTNRGIALTRKLLGFSAKQALGAKLSSLNDFIENMEELLVKSLTVAIKVENHLSSDLWSVNVDPGELEDTILNLALNARDAMPDGGILTIETINKFCSAEYTRNKPDATAGEYVMLSISDTGHGITEDQKEYIFDPFFSTKEDGRGTGLGLSMVYGFVRRSNGFIELISEPGTGTTFRIFLPRASENQDNGTDTKLSQITLLTGTETILVVDDEQELVDIAISDLTDLGYRTLSANSGDQAWEIIKSDESIDLVFSDVVMPGEFDGFQLAIEAQKKRPTLKALLTSGFTQKMEKHLENEDGQYAGLAGNLLAKPYNRTELASAVRRTLDNKT